MADATSPDSTGADASSGEAATESGAPARDARPRKKRTRKKAPKGERRDDGGGRGGAGRREMGRRETNRGEKGRGGRPSEGGRDHHALGAVKALSQMASDLLEIEGIDFLARPRFMEVSVKIPLDAKRDGKQAANSLVEQVLRRVQEVRAHDRALVAGSVFDYHSEQETARPAEPREVFDGYSSTGRPQFTDFVTMAIERKDDGIDELLNGEDRIVTHVSLGRVLRTQQLPEWGGTSPVFRILGQVDAGLYPVVNGPHKAAFSFQLLRGVTLEGKPRLRLHPVGAVDVRDLADSSVAEILRRFQQTLDAESLRLAGQVARKTEDANGDASSVEVDEEEFVLPLLQDLAKRLAGRAKRRGRRTEHAVQRADEGQRPTPKASSDANEADDEHILEDDSEGTIVILGPRGRVHVYTRDARHITSIMMTGSNVQKRRQEGRWRAADPGARGEFRIALRRRLAAPDDDAAQPKDEGGPSAPQ